VGRRLRLDLGVAFDGTRLAACRQARDWSQVELAERLVQARTDGPASVLDAARQIRTLVVQVSCYESGRTRPRAKAVQALAAVLGVDVLQLLAPGTPVTLVTLRATGADPGRRRCRAGHQPQPLRRRRAG
jgi:transcriptional regulator with XRE-family HTH domain